MTPISRREALQRAALLLGAAVSPSILACAERAATRPGGAATPAYLTAAQFAIASAMAERILPRTNTPGALDVGVPSFIDLAYGQFMTAAEKKTLADGLSAADAASQSTHRTAFASASADQQDAVLKSLASASAGQTGTFFPLIRQATIVGYFTSEEVGRKVLHYDPVPGRFDPCVPTSEVGNVNWTV
jgi:gluconate 2-dehydrogenase gamma chain